MGKKDHKRVFFLRIFASDPIEVLEMPETIEIFKEGDWTYNNAGGKRRTDKVDKDKEVKGEMTM